MLTKEEIKEVLEPYKYKQIIVIRKDLKMRRGKEIAQASHAVQLAYMNHQDDPRMIAWCQGPFAKICVYVESEEEFLELAQKARDAGIICETILDQGRTEFKGVKTLTAMVIGPDKHEVLDPITGHLKLL